MAMNKPTRRVYSRYAIEALKLMGASIRAARIEKRISTANLAERAGISRDMLYRIEKGDPRCEIGVVFELAAIVGIVLYEPNGSEITHRLHRTNQQVALMPKAIHPEKQEVKDDF